MLKEKVKEHGQKTFYAIKDNDGARRADTTNFDFEAFDQYKLEDVELSLMLVFSLITSTFSEKMEIRFDNQSQFLVPLCCFSIHDDGLRNLQCIHRP